MLQLLIVVGRALALGLRGHRELVLENLALRQPADADEAGEQPSRQLPFRTSHVPRRVARDDEGSGAEAG